MGSDGRPYRTEQVDGFEVLVGKGDARNDTLTFGVAEPRDFWLHVAGVPGSHVVVRNPESLDALPRPVLERAAALAAWHSKARGARGKVEVHWCRVADVQQAARLRAGRGAAPPVRLHARLPRRLRRRLTRPAASDIVSVRS